MTPDEREALVERMAEALWDAMPNATPHRDLTDAAINDFLASAVEVK